MHFAKMALFWQCIELHSSESNPTERSNHGRKIRRLGSNHKMKRMVQVFQQTQFVDVSEAERIMSVVYHGHLLSHRDVVELWQTFIQTYRTYGLTKESDIFVALQGISQDVVVDTLKDRMIAGLLESRLIEQLCWRITNNNHQGRLGDESYRPKKWRAPSWSWASTKLEIIMPTPQRRGNERHRLSKIVKCHAPTKLSGELIEASLWIKCQPLAMVIVSNGPNHSLEYPGIVHPGVRTPFRIFMDDPSPPGLSVFDFHTRSVYMMALHYDEFPTEEPSVIYGLILTPDGDSDERFRGIGVFQLGSDESDQQLATRETLHGVLRIVQEAESRVIELV
jgi:hypothetical protein